MTKRMKGIPLLLMTSLLLVVPGRAQTGPPLNPLKIALLHWYTANQSASFTVGTEPYGLAFDGANIWTANYGANTVTKLRATVKFSVRSTSDTGRQARRSTERTCGSRTASTAP